MTDSHGRCLAIVGAAGAVGREMIAILESRRCPCEELRLFGNRSAGLSIGFHGSPIVIQRLTDETMTGVDLALFSAGSTTARQFAPHMVRQGTIVIDNSSAFRADPNCPLVIPEINPEALHSIDLAQGGIIANPNCSTIIMLMAATPVHKRWGVMRMIVSTYQAASGAGRDAMLELESQSRAVLHGKDAVPHFFAEPSAFNVFSHNSPIDDQGFNGEEKKMLTETQRLWDNPGVHVHATCIRVPVMRAHCESIHLTLEKGVQSIDEVRACIAEFEGVELLDDRAGNVFPTPLKATGRDDVLVGRLRLDESTRDLKGLCHGVSLFAAGDQLRKGAALNAIQIAQSLLTRTTTTTPA